MKTIAITTAVIAALAAPAFANNSVADRIFAEHAASNQEQHLYGSNSGSEVVSTQSFGGTGVAEAIFAEHAASDDELNGYRGLGNEVVSTQSYGTNLVAEHIFAAEFAASREDE